MTTKEIKEFNKRVTAFIDTRRLRDAIVMMKDMARRRMAWEVGDKIEKTEQNYAYMLKYVSSGSSDPERDSVYQGIINELFAELDALTFYMEKIENISLYYSTIRFNDRNPAPDRILRLLDTYRELSSKMSIFSLLSQEGGKGEEQENRSKLERAQLDLFNALWTTPKLRSEDASALQSMLQDNEFSAGFKIHVISALMLGCMQMLDYRKLELLMDAYMQPGIDDASRYSQASMQVSSAALIAMLLVMWRYSSRPMPRTIQNRMSAIKEMQFWSSDLRQAQIEFIVARDTERINRKIQDEVIPDMLKLRPELMSKLNESGIEALDIAALQENPEWKELMDKNGLTDKLKELTEMQMEGADVMMSTFSHLKNFPFFNEVSNWFLPFDSNHTSLANAVDESGLMSEMMEHAKFLCDNDKYSFMFAINIVPKEQRELMSSQFKQQADGIYSVMNSQSDAIQPEKRRMALKAFMQNVYRFYKLSRRRDEFFDPFSMVLNLSTVPVLAEDFNDEEYLEPIANLYFKRGYMQDALETFKKLEDLLPGNAHRYQQMGYCEEKLQHYDEAIDYYERAELLDAKPVWTIRRLAACYKAKGQTEKALEYYSKLAELLPDDEQTTLMLGYMHLENEDYQAALHQFYKVEFLNEKSTRSWRPLAWTLFLTGDFEASKRYYDKILSLKPTANDYLNMGHLALAQGNMRDAINNYAVSMEKADGNSETYISNMREDAKQLRRLGVSEDLIPLVIDAVLYKGK